MLSSYWMNNQKDCWVWGNHYHYIGKSKRFQLLPENQNLECSQKCGNSVPENVVALQMSNNKEK